MKNKVESTVRSVVGRTSWENFWIKHKAEFTGVSVNPMQSVGSVVDRSSWEMRHRNQRWPTLPCKQINNATPIQITWLSFKSRYKKKNSGMKGVGSKSQAVSLIFYVYRVCQSPRVIRSVDRNKTSSELEGQCSFCWKDIRFALRRRAEQSRTGLLLPLSRKRLESSEIV